MASAMLTDYSAALVEVWNEAAAGESAAPLSLDDGTDFSAMLKNYLEENSPLQKIDGQTLRQQRMKIQEEAIEVIMRRTLKAGAPNTENAGSLKENETFAANFSASLNWFSRSTGAKTEFLAQMERLSIIQPPLVRSLVDLLANMQQTMKLAAAGLDTGVSGVSAVRSQISAIEFSFAGAGFTDAELADTLGVKRVTVQMQLQMQALTSFAAAAPGAAGESAITIFGQEIDLQTYMLFMDPLVLDLKGDGINLRGLAEDGGVIFDLSGNGKEERCGFVQGDDALLFYDRDGDGLCSNGLELFGDQEGDANGFAKLRKFDSDGNGVIDAADGEYKNLRVWNDFNGDGRCTADEVRSLPAADVGAISVGYRRTHDVNHGNIISERGFYAALDGTIREAVDARFRCVPAQA